jgi:CheY-like chemotaxis protein
MSGPQRVERPEEVEAPRSEPARRSAFADSSERAAMTEPDLRNPLAIVITNLELLANMVLRLRVDSDAFPLSPEAEANLASQLREAESCVRDAQVAAQRIREVVAPAKPLPQRASGLRAAVELNVMRPARILIVDDDAGIGRALQRLFRDYDVVVHTSAKHAVDRIAIGERFDVVLSDVAMPGMSGPALYVEIQRLAPDQARRVIFITGGASDDQTARFLATVGQPVLTKPFDPPELRKFIKKFME